MNNYQILMVDDDPDDRWMMEDALNTMGVEGIISFALNGEHALQMLDNLHRDVDTLKLIILDLNMPVMNGTETLNRIKKDPRFNSLPVIIYSTSINPSEKEKCMKLGATSYITKPVSVNESIQTAKTFLSFCKA